MNKPGRIPSLLLAAMASAPAAVMADPGQFYLTPFVGWQQFDKSRNIDDHVTWGLGGEYQISEHWGAELDYSEAHGTRVRNREIAGLDLDLNKVDVNVRRLSLDGIFYFGRHGWDRVFEPYLKAGVGHSRYNYSNSFLNDHNKTNDTDLDLGAGIRFHFNDHWSTRLEAKAIYETRSYQTNGLYTIGVSYAFGAPAKRAVALPPPAAVEPPPPPPAPMVLTKTENMRLEITFDFNKAVIREQYMGEVERAANFLKKYPGVHAVIEGHTDSVGSDAYNLKLSERRAEAVRNALITRYGIAEDRLSAKGFGKSQPIASNDTAEGRAQNRRVIASMKAETKQTVPQPQQ